MPFHGYQAKCGVGDAEPVTVPLDIQTNTLGTSRSYADANGLKGTRSPFAARKRRSQSRVSGTLTWNPGVRELAYILPKILGGTPAGTSYPLAELLPPFFCWEARGQRIHKFTGCKVSRATFRCASDTPLELSIDVVAISEDQATAAGSFPAIQIGTGLDDQPLMFHDSSGAVSIDSSIYGIPDWELTIDNAIDAERFLNSTTLASVNPTDRAISVRTRIPWDAFVLSPATEAGVPMTITFTNGAVSLAISTPLVQFDQESVRNQQGRGENFLELAGMAGASAALNELTMTLDSTP